MLRRVKVHELERGLAFKRGRAARFLRPGTHWLFGLGWTVRVEPVTQLAFTGSELEIELLSGDPATWGDLAFARPGDAERVLVWIDGRLRFVRRGACAFWRVLRDVRVELVPAQLLLPTHLVAAALAAEGAAEELVELVVPPGFNGWVLVDQKVHRVLEPGRHAAWRGTGRIELALVPTGTRTLAFPVTEVWTRDLATVGVEVAFQYRVTDPRRFALEGGSTLTHLRAAAIGAAQDVVGRHTLGRLLGERAAIGLALEDALAERAPPLHVEVRGARLGKLTVLRRFPRRRFRGFGACGREVALSLRDFPTPAFRQHNVVRRH